MTFAPKEVILGATLPLENGSTITFSVAGHVEAERDLDDAVVIFGRKLLKYTNSATDADRLTVRQVISSITSTPLDKVPDVGTPTSPAPVKEPAKVAPPMAASTPVMGPAPTVAEQAAAVVARVVKPPAPAETPAAEDVCERCGGAVPKSQAKLSMLFMNKTLCKKCQAEASP
jgi:hypothetical protein